MGTRTKSLLDCHKNVPRRPPSLQTLPPEILSEIASWLDIQTLWHFRQINKRIRGIADACLFRRGHIYCEKHFGYVRPYGGHIDEIPKDQARQWIRKRLRFDEFCQSQSIPNDIFRVRSYKVDVRCQPRSGEGDKGLLLPGGRWFLLIEDSGSVHVCDLEMRRARCSLLIKGGRGDRRPCMSACKVISEASSELEFILSVRYRGKISEHCCWIKCYLIRQHGQGRSATLAVQRTIATFPVSRFAVDFRLRDDLVGVTCQHTEGFHVSEVLELVKWRECSMSDLVISAFRALRQSQQISLLANDRMLCVDDTTITLHTVPPYRRIPFSEIVHHESAYAVRDPVWTYTVSTRRFLGWTNISQAYFDGAAERVVIVVSFKILGLLIPPSGEGCPLVQFSLDIKHEKMPPIVGLYKAYVPNDVAGDISSFALASYSWNDEGNTISAPATHKKIKHVSQLYFDEETGRIVFVLHRNYHTSIKLLNNGI